MTDFNQFHDNFANVPPPSKKMPDMINVLSILTFIGCALGLIMAFYSFATVCQSIQTMEESMTKLGDNNPMAGVMDSAMASLHKQCEMKLPILIISIVCNVLCFIGAMQMRGLKKAGFFMYLIGEVAGPVASLVLIGGGMMGGLALVGMLIPVVFVILYATQLKHLK